MTISEFMEALVMKFPRHAAAIEGWEDQYRALLSHHQGDALKRACDAVFATWDSNKKAAFPKPADFRAKIGGDDSPKYGGGADLWSFMEENTGTTVEKCVQDARRRCIEAHGIEVADKCHGFIKWHAHRLANYYVQRRFRAQKDERFMNGARWKFTDREIEELASRAATRDILAARMTGGLKAMGS